MSRRSIERYCPLYAPLVWMSGQGQPLSNNYVLGDVMPAARGVWLQVMEDEGR